MKTLLKSSFLSTDFLASVSLGLKKELLMAEDLLKSPREKL
jgi:hypothetical protein